VVQRAGSQYSRPQLPANVRQRLVAVQKSHDPVEIAALARMLDGSVRRELRPTTVTGLEVSRLVTRPGAAAAGDSVRSRRHLQRKLWRIMRGMRQRDAGQYLSVCEVLLAGYDDAGVSDGVALLDSYVLMHVLFHDSAVVRCTSSGWVLVSGASLSDLQWSPAFPQVWTGAAEILWRLTQTAGSRVVRRWAALGLRVVGVSQLQVELSEITELFGRSESGDAELAFALLVKSGFAGRLSLTEALSVLAGLSQCVRSDAAVGLRLQSQIEDAGGCELISDGVLQSLILLLPHTGLGAFVWDHLQGRRRSGLDWLLPLLDCADERIGREVQEHLNERRQLCAGAEVWLRLLGVCAPVAAAWQLQRMAEPKVLAVISELLSGPQGPQLVRAMWNFWQRSVEQPRLPLGFRRLALQQAGGRVRQEPGELWGFEPLLCSALGSRLAGLRNAALQWLAVGVNEGWLSAGTEVAGVELL
jgi:hypothetical protein